MEQTRAHKYITPAAVLTVLLFLAGRLNGDSLGSNSWSFVHWSHLSIVYTIGWGVAAIIVAIGLTRFLPAMAAFFEFRRNRIIGGVLLLALAAGLRYDSFLYSGGNLRIAQVAQAEDLVVAWFEFGTVWSVYLLHQFWSLFPLHANTAGLLAWQTLSLAATGLMLIGAHRTARLLSEDPTRRFGFFLILLFGPQLLIYFGFVGFAPVIAAASLWSAYWIVRVCHRGGRSAVAGLWLSVGLGLFFHAANLYLVPAAVAATVAPVVPRLRPLRILPFLAGSLVLGGLLASVYVLATENLLVKSNVLLLGGKNPFGDYSLFSLRHLSDFGQTLFLLFPLVLVVLLLAIQQGRRILTSALSSAAMLMLLGVLAAMFIADPVHGIVLDLPTFAGWLLPGAFLLVVLIRDRKTENGISPAVVGLLGAISLLLPLSILPSYSRIHDAENYVTSYLDRHTAYYRTAAISLRDAYFYRQELDRANYWDQNYGRKSPDYLNLRGITQFVDGGRLDIALPSLNKLIARNPYWAEPRALYGTLMMLQGQFATAKPHLDTALMLEPGNPVHYINRYAYFRDQGNFPAALKLVQEASALFPNNTDVRTDLMLINYRAGNRDEAAQLADEFLNRDSTEAYPYVVKGFLAEAAGDLDQARRYFEKFADLAPDAPEAPQIRKRANDLYLRLRDRQ